MEWLIYRHISPSGKCYIGQTNQKPESRWNNGKVYSRAFKFGKAIDRYGWENFTHEILESHILTQELANEREIFLLICLIVLLMAIILQGAAIIASTLEMKFIK